MPVLLEIYSDGGGFEFESDGTFIFLTDSEFVFDSASETLRVSTENFAGSRFWSGDILSVEPLKYQCREYGGGLVCPLGLSSVEIAMQAFVDASLVTGNTEANWKSTAVYWNGRFYWADSVADDPVYLLDCKLYIKKIDVPRSYTFAVYSDFPHVNLLTEATDYDGNTTALPQAFGKVSYVHPVRLPDSGGNQVYSACGLVGTKHVDWHVFDDGVDICSNATAISSDTFQLTVAPVGDVTVSGYGNAATSAYFSRLSCSLDVLFPYLAWLVSIPLIDGSTFSNTVELNTFIDSQVEVSKFMDKVCAAFNYIASYRLGYITLYEHDNKDTLTATLDAAADCISVDIERRGPLRRVSYKYKVRESVSETIGQYVKETEKEVYWDGFGELSVGEAIEIDAMDDAEPFAAQFTCYFWWLYNQTFAFTMVLPLKEYLTDNADTMLYPGLEITVEDYRYDERKLTYTCHVIDASYDFTGKTITLSGHAEVTETAL